MLTSDSHSSKIVCEAESWLGTPYHHAADVKGLQGGVDCAMFLVRVFVDTGTVPEFDPRPYSMQFYLHRNEPRYLNWVEQYGLQVKTPAVGDVALFRMGRAIGHGGIYVGEDKLIHAYKQAGFVVRTELLANEGLRKRLVGFWRVRHG